MQKLNKKTLFLIIITLITAMVFGISAVCGGCGARDLDEEEKTDVKNSGTQEDQSPGQSNEDGEGKKSEPTVDLKIVEGPEYSAVDDVCFYRVEAEVAGNPAPDIEWSKDDSNSSYGDNIAQVNLTRDEPDYTLVATVKNSEGSATESIDLSWGCDGDNSDPEITSIDISEDDISAGETYGLTAVAQDPDGDAITYKWTADDGAISDDDGNPTQWTAPLAEGDFKITLTVRDGKGGESTKDLEVNVTIPLPPAVANTFLPNVGNEGGYIEETGFVNEGGCLFAGDSGAPNADYAGNKGVRGYISYDISSLAGVTVTDAELTFNLKQLFGDPSSFGHLFISRVKWGQEQLTVDDFDLAGAPICDFAGYGTGDLLCDSPQLVDQLQDSIDNGDQRFQLRINFANLSDGDNNWDGLEYDQSDINLFVEYEMP